MRVQTEEWQRFIPGVRMYKGKKTLFYNGEILWDENGGYGLDTLIYNRKDRDSWEVIIILPGVEVIPEYTFEYCKSVKKVIMHDSVRRIEDRAFLNCYNLFYIRLSKTLEYIGFQSFYYCESLSSVFIPPSCLEIDDSAFSFCKKLIILSVPQETQLGNHVIQDTALFAKAEELGISNDSEQVNEFVHLMNHEAQYSLHRECASFETSEDNIFEILKERGLQSFVRENHIGITAARYLEENPFSEIDEFKLINKLVLDLMGEVMK
ncbi:hypothetical protein CTEN210_13542 [Chaetoceros tenuissimus]|uniref:Leucine-rich repeat domain-containing protein n=1 Tax=Chaetoceros tenuissimus TaxID=426638 RepID=A0AAD3D5I0_9STRA|nr:hypothetical protein CTEN210_13542 [Chaetoceros tenuissimus]